MITDLFILLAILILVIMDLILQPSTRFYAILQFLAGGAAVLALIVMAINKIVNHSNYFPDLLFVMLGIIGLVRFYKSLKNQKLIM